MSYRICSHRPVPATDDEARQYGKLYVLGRELDAVRTDPIWIALDKKLNPYSYIQCSCPIYRGVLACISSDGVLRIRAKIHGSPNLGQIFDDYRDFRVNDAPSVEAAVDNVWEIVYSQIKSRLLMASHYLPMDDIPWEIHNVPASIREEVVTAYRKERTP